MLHARWPARATYGIHGRGELIIEKTVSANEHIAQILKSAGIGTELSPSRHKRNLVG